MYHDWQITKTKEGTYRMNPQLPRVLEFLMNYKRVAELNQLELLQLNQIDQWIEGQILNERLPEQFRLCIPEKVVVQARDKFSEYDASSLFPQEQVDVAKKLLKLRVTFAENKKIGK